jgi:hypothetical protein
METLMIIAFFSALLGLGYWLTKKRGRKVESDKPPAGHTPKLPKWFDGSKGWFGRRDD